MNPHNNEQTEEVNDKDRNDENKMETPIMIIETTRFKYLRKFQARLLAGLKFKRNENNHGEMMFFKVPKEKRQLIEKELAKIKTNLAEFPLLHISFLKGITEKVEKYFEQFN